MFHFQCWRLRNENIRSNCNYFKKPLDILDRICYTIHDVHLFLFCINYILEREREMNNTLLDNYDKMVVKDTVAVIHCAFGDTPHTVAMVSVDKGLSDIQKCEKAFMLTNSIDDAWWNNKDVTAMFPNDGCRSTSVGDQVLVGNTKYVCDSFGWSKV